MSSSHQQKSSKNVALGALAVLAVAVGAYSCSRPNEEVTAYCVTSDGYNGAYQVVDEYHCDDDGYGDDYGSSSSGSYGSYGSYSGSPSYGSYFWYYGGRYSAGRVSGGSSVRPSGPAISSHGGRSISRGGFGGSFGGGS